jgi:hypothetical protein
MADVNNIADPPKLSGGPGSPESVTLTGAPCIVCSISDKRKSEFTASRPRRSVSPSVAEILEDCALRGQPARRAAQAIFDGTGQRYSERTIARWIARWRARRNRNVIFRDLGIALAAMRGDERALQSLKAQHFFGDGQQPARAEELISALRIFIGRPTPAAMAAVVLSCLSYQLEVSLTNSIERAKAREPNSE